MAPLTYVDTHVVAWLYEGRLDLFPGRVRDAIERGDLLVSPMVELELQYLYELGRIIEPGATVVSAVSRDLGVNVCAHPFRSVVAAAAKLRWTRDPFDRIIVGHAVARDARLLTRDRSILHHYRRATWG